MVLVFFNLETVFCVNWLLITFAQFFQKLLVPVCMLYLVNYTQVLWQVTLVLKSC
jgi:hypothetical protein